MPANHFRPNSLNARLAGFSLVELMISITIGLILLLGLATLLFNSSATHTEMQKSSAQIENGRYAIEVLREEIQLAGYYGEYSPTAYNEPELPCVTAATAVPPALPPNNNMPSPIGYDLTAVAADFACMTDHLADTGVLVLRRVQTVAATVAPPCTTATCPTYVQVSQCNSDSAPAVFRFLVADASPAGEFTLREIDCLTKASVRKFVVHIYYISTCNVCAPSDGIPTLKMVEYVDGAAQTPVALVEGIEDMQFDYGIDNVVPVDGSPDTYVTAPATAADWANVMAVRVHLLARNIVPTTGYDDSKTYALGLAKPSYTVTAGTTARTYKRHAYTTLVRVENPSSRRETP